jgi:FtsP/CotA-like multicopper oxidase with cupredoxin domain
VRPVQGRYFPLATAQRLDVLVELPASAGVFPVVALAEGTRMRTGVVLTTPGSTVKRIPTLSEAEAPPADLSLEARLSAASPLPVRSPASTYRVALTGGMMGYVWGIDGRTWAGHTPLVVRRGQSCALELINDSMMPHPMHLHGHHFQVMALNGQPFQGAVRDTVLVPPMTSVTVAFVADNPGRWLFHCHNLYHMMAGMMTEVIYA